MKLINENTGGFKLLGVRIHKDCHQVYRKILNPGQIYTFYNAYKFLNEKGNNISEDDCVHEIKPPESHCESIYDRDNLKINISAIVGKNGSGKSSLLETLYLSVYYLGVKLDILETHYGRLQNYLAELVSTNKIADIEALSSEMNDSRDEHIHILENFKASCILRI